ncbi:MAG TPA: type VI secretion system tube protein Hcp [Terracidiphilus sp.]
MKRPGILTLGISAFALCCASIASAKSVGTLACTGSNSQVKFNVSFFDFGITNSTDIGSQSSGSGAGKIVLKPLEVHAALSTFASLTEAAASGTAFQSCTLTTAFNDGSQTQFEFRMIIISSLTAVASMPAQENEPARYTDVQFEYGAIEVKTNSGLDDGGTTPLPAGWNVGHNKNN